MQSSLSRRRFLAQTGQVALGASLAGSLFAACGDSGTGSTNTLSYWLGVDDAKQRLYIQQHDIKDYMSSHKDVQIKLSFKPNSDIDRLLQIALPAGNGPDLVPTPGPSYSAQYTSSNLLLDLDKYATQYKWQNKIFDWALQSGRVNGKLYSLPTSYETMLFYYNKNLFSQHGWTVPKNRADLEAFAADAAGHGITPFIAGSADWKPATEWFVTVFLNHYAGPDAVYQALSGKVSWKDPIFVESIDLMNKYFQKGWFGGGVKQYFTNKFDTIDTAFAQGKAAVDLEGSWAFQNWPNFFDGKMTKMDYDWAPIPALRSGLPDNIFALGIGSTLSINAKSKAADAAAKYMDWLFTTPQRVTNAMGAIGSEPLPIPLKESDFPAAVDKRLRDSYLSINESAQKGSFGYTTWTFWPPKSDTFMYEGMDKVLTGNLKPADFCSQLDDIFKKELAQGVVPPLPKGKA
ncbi:ABC transporter substrate-binding protein [Dictyobacter formicarum]|uniref:ABC transporter substrate-binding protein n=1 Tax=Dictyobacter formicarum TaxID=2778368 RepID=A0ABQ3VMH8_9CHLR|nr:extracellular solute-binding protein [Dictyobacter formicarum]GHO87310.1 ABC transporter substrate-binding protein [Dictyobacter formicarum]